MYRCTDFAPTMADSDVVRYIFCSRTVPVEVERNRPFSMNYMKLGTDARGR